MKFSGRTLVGRCARSSDSLRIQPTSIASARTPPWGSFSSGSRGGGRAACQGLQPRCSSAEAPASSTRSRTNHRDAQTALPLLQGAPDRRRPLPRGQGAHPGGVLPHLSTRSSSRCSCSSKRASSALRCLPRRADAVEVVQGFIRNFTLRMPEKYGERFHARCRPSLGAQRPAEARILAIRPASTTGGAR